MDATTKNMNGPDLVYPTTKWTRRQYAESMANAPQALETLRKGQEKQPLFNSFQRETFHRFYNFHDPEPMNQIKPEAQWSANAQREMADLPEFKTLRQRTNGDELYSTIAAAAVAEEMLSAIPDAPQEAKENDLDQLRRQLESLQTLADKTEAGEAKDRLNAAADQTRQTLDGAAAACLVSAGQMDSGETRQAIRRGSEKAQKEIDDAENAARCYSAGNADGTQTTSNADKLKAYEVIKNNPKLARIAQIAGRLKIIAAQKRRTKSNAERSEIVGIEQGDDLNQTLPEDLVTYYDPQTRGEFTERMEAKKLNQFKLGGKRKQGKGPIVILKDRSGSMIENDKDIWSKAVCLTMAEHARREKRDFALLHYSHTVDEEHLFPANARPTTEQLINSILISPSGGTRIQNAINRGLDLIAQTPKMKPSDLVIITDGLDEHPDPEPIKRRAAALNVHIIAVVIDSGPADTTTIQELGADVTTLRDIAEANARENEIAEKLFTL